MQHLVGFLSEINAKNVDLYLHVQGLDTSTPSGRAMFAMLGVFAEFERSILRDRIKAGLARSDKKSGRPSLHAFTEHQAKKLLEMGTSINATAKKLRIGVATVHRIKTRMAQTA